MTADCWPGTGTGRRLCPPIWMITPLLPGACWSCTRLPLPQEYLRDALDLTPPGLRTFLGQENGGFFFYGKDAEQLIMTKGNL